MWLQMLLEARYSGSNSRLSTAHPCSGAGFFSLTVWSWRGKRSRDCRGSGSAAAGASTQQPSDIATRPGQTRRGCRSLVSQASQTESSFRETLLLSFAKLCYPGIVTGILLENL
eukprot:m.164931 g.164931  ORF g.164931 m.164931 type:complete len:114 (-) comp15228_c0_seq7:257-598(-)